MALRIRKDGRIFCAALHKQEKDDLYIDDDLHYELSVIRKLIGTEEHEKHNLYGQWWWMNNIPENVVIDNFYKSTGG